MKPHASLLPSLLAAFLLASCLPRTGPDVSPDRDWAELLIRAAYGTRDYGRILSLADSLEPRGDISAIEALYWRGYAYSRQRDMRHAELEWTQAVSLPVENVEDLDYYAQSANRLTGLLYLQFDYEAALRIGLEALTVMENWQFTGNTDYANIQAFMGNCQLRLDQHDKARRSYDEAYETYLQLTQNTRDITLLSASVIGLVAINEAHQQASEYEDAYLWTQRLEEMLDQYCAHPDADPDFIDKQTGRLYFYRACALEKGGKSEEAREAYRAGSATRYAQTADGKIESSRYLFLARRWNEAADMFDVLEEQSSRYDVRPALENIRSMMAPKYLANRHAGRNAAAIATADRIFEVLDSAIMREKRDAALEMAALYDIKVKETQLAEERASMALNQFWSAVYALIFIAFLAFVVIYYRHQSSLRLEQAFVNLEEANARAEESSKMKSDFIQQISHEIRTPLNIVNGFTQILTTSEADLDAESRAQINREVTANTERITGLISKMLELSDAHSQTVINRTELVSPMQIAAIASDASGATTAPHVLLYTKVSEAAQKALLLTDKKSASRVLTLVMDNARKFTAPPDASAEGLEAKRVSLRVDVDGDWVRFTVEDTGVGIPIDKAEAIFEEFVQLDNFYDGIGIGLPVARSMARRLGGDLTLDTSYTKGARFVYTLPLAKDLEQGTE